MVFIQPALLKSFLQYRVSYRFENFRNTQSESGSVSSSNHCSLQVPLHDAGVTSSSGDEEFTFVRAVVDETSACHLSRVPSYFMIRGLGEGKKQKQEVDINFIFNIFFRKHCIKIFDGFIFRQLLTCCHIGDTSSCLKC